jgi:hypothetical protein
MQLLKDMELKIGKNLIDKQDGLGLDIFNELHDTHDFEHEMIGKMG